MKPGVVGGASAAVLSVVMAAFSACLMLPTADVSPDLPPRGSADEFRLVAFDSCEEALGDFRRSALQQVGPYGLPGTGTGRAADAMERDAGAEAAAGIAGRSAPSHSTTNIHEPGADEPDLVKTDGRRLVTIVDGTLRVIDVAAQAVTGSVKIRGGHAAKLLLHGERALVLTQDARFGPAGEGPEARPYLHTAASELVLVDLRGAARIVGRLTVDGGYLDARQSGSIARVVLRSGPRLDFGYPDRPRSAGAALRENQAIIRRSAIEDWLPRFELRRNGTVSAGRLVGCSSVSHPATGAGTSLVTVLTIDLTRELDKGDPVSVTADGGTVYGTGKNLYVADDQVPVDLRGFDPAGRGLPVRQQQTKIYQFDTSGPGRPEFVASGAVEGRLLNQYSLSEHAGHLRIATTTGELRATATGRPKTESALTVLARRGDRLVRVGHVGGLGRGERIYAVRFLGDTGYVVTFRETDPLYSLDLSDPARPRVRGELKITGYSAYLHPVGAGRLLGVGQEATKRGRTTGSQVSLFDTSDADRPRRVAHFHVAGAHSEVEHDPHAFLYWPDQGLVIFPVWLQAGERVGRDGSAVLVLRLSGDALTEVGRVSHPVPDGHHGEPVRRAVVIGDELWTVSASGTAVSTLDTMTRTGWIRFG